MNSLIQVSESNTILYISSSPFFAQLTTVRDTGGNRSTSNTISISTTSNFTFADGSSRKTIDTPYASITFDSQGRIQHSFPFTYGGTTDAVSLTIEGPVTPKSSHFYDSLYVSNSISSIGKLDTQSFVINGTPVYNTMFLVSNVQSLGQTYISSVDLGISKLNDIGYVFSNDLVSTVAGLGESYISLDSLKSTVDGLGTYGYVSVANLTSTTEGLSSTYISTSNMNSVVDGLGREYMSTATFLSSFSPFADGYILSQTYVSTNNGLGTSKYISISQLTSTIQGLGSLKYISTSWLTSTVAGLSSCNLSGDSTLLFTSTVAGLGQTYLSTGGLVSSTLGLQTLNTTILQSTIHGLGTAGYISLPHLVSSVKGLSNLYTPVSDLLSTTTGFFTPSYTTSFISTVQGLSNTYVTTLRPTVSNILSIEQVQLISTVDGVTPSFLVESHIVSTVQGLGSIYVSTPSLLIHTSNFIESITYPLYPPNSNDSNSYTNLELTSSIINLGTKGYVSSQSLTSTIQGLGVVYVSSPSLISTVQGLPYVLTQSLVTGTSTEESAFDSLYRTNLISFVNGLGTTGYLSSFFTYSSSNYSLSTANLTSTTVGIVTALGALPPVSSNVILTPTTGNTLYVYSGGITQSSNVSVYTGGIQTKNLYCFSPIDAKTFVAVQPSGANGFYYADGTQLTSSSDRRRKTEITLFSNALSIVEALDGISYLRKDDSTPQIGFIAQDVERILPELVFTSADGTKSLRYESIAVIILEALKELNGEYESLLSQTSVETYV